MKLAKIKMDDFGGAPVCDHNMPCAVCGIKPAVYQLNLGYFHPCWNCQEEGWRIIQMKSKRMKWILKFFKII